MNQQPPVEILSKTAMVRILFEITHLPPSKKEFTGNQKTPIKIKKVDVFPLAFVFSEDCLQDNYTLINQAIHQESHKILQNLPMVDPGVYELVGEFFGKFSLQDNQVISRVWQVDDVKAYQLSEEEIALLPITLRPEGEISE